jgi:hypothetical protein
MTKPFDRARSIYEEIKVRVYGPLGSETPTCAEALTTAGLIAELQNRVEALEAAAKPVESNYLEKPDSSLVERVARAFTARKAILSVADWLDQQELYVAATRLRMEVR